MTFKSENGLIIPKKGGSMKIILSVVFFLCLAQAAKLGEVEFSDTYQLETKSLVLNGLGKREATWLAIDVYIAALYLEKKEQSADSIINDSTHKSLQMKFVRDVEKEKVIDSYQESFEKIMGEEYSSNKSVTTFLNSMQEMKEGMVMALDFYQDKLALSFNGKRKVVIQDKEFQKNVLKIWLGKYPPNKDLKKGLLGLL